MLLRRIGKKAKNPLRFIVFITFVFLWGCQKTSRQSDKKEAPETESQNPIIDYFGTPKKVKDDSLLAFSDQGAWFAFAIPTDLDQGGFSGPFLMTQDNGIWASQSLVRLALSSHDDKQIRDWTSDGHVESSPLAGITLTYKNDDFEIRQRLFYASSRTTAVEVTVKNISSEKQSFRASFHGELMAESLTFQQGKEGIEMASTQEDAIGILRLPKGDLELTDESYKSVMEETELQPGEGRDWVYSLSFLFPKDEGEKEEKIAESVKADFTDVFQNRVEEKSALVDHLNQSLSASWQKSEYKDLLLKTVLTLQNNWRSSAGKLHHAGLFPSYHSKWFQGFWAWDSWKHAAALATFNPELAKEQILAMYDYMEPNGFIPDDIFRNNLYEENNYRDTKPPLSAWAVWAVYKADKDRDFLKTIYPKLKKQHQWWYDNRDHDQNGLCEYGSTDGTLIAAKWESGMDNAVRFDDSEIVKNGEKSYSLNQESVDLNSYLYAEKVYLAKIAEVLGNTEENDSFTKAAQQLKEKIRDKFYDEETGWFYDRKPETGELIKVKGPEGWIPLWAKVASKEQAGEVLKSIMDPELFNTKVPFPTLNGSHEKFQPENGYWRGPVWLDQAYFGVKGLRNYGFQKEAEELTRKLFHNAEGVLNSGRSIRENYNPVTGEGLESQNFSWSAAHYLLLLLDK